MLGIVKGLYLDSIAYFSKPEKLALKKKTKIYKDLQGYRVGIRKMTAAQGF